MATKPTNKAEWATGGASITEPLLAEKQAGWPVSFKPPAQWFNWWMKLVHQWVVWLDAFESEAHTWTALQTFNAGVLAPAFAATPGIRGTSAVVGVPAVKGTATVSGAPGVWGESNHELGFGGYFLNTATTGIGNALYAEGRSPIIGVSSWYSAVTGSLQAGSEPTSSAGVLGESNMSGRPGVRGHGGAGAAAWGGEFIGSDPEESSTHGGLGLRVRGGPSSLTDGTFNAGNGFDVAAGDATGDGSIGYGSNAGTNYLRGGHVDGLLNDEGLPGVGLTIQGGNVNDDSNNRIGGVGLVVAGGVGQAGRGKSIQALGDAELTGYLQMIASTLASSTPQNDLLSPGLMVKAWARVQWTGGGISIIAGQNVAAVGFQTAASGRWYLDLARSVTKTSRCVVSIGDTSNSGGGKLNHPIDTTTGDAFGRSDTRVVFEVTDAATPTTVNLSSTNGTAYVVVMGV